jgi:hypothetical protein
LKADFIATLPMQPRWLRLLFILNAFMRRNLVCSEVDQTVKCYHIRSG